MSGSGETNPVGPGTQEDRSDEPTLLEHFKSESERLECQLDVVTDAIALLEADPSVAEIMNKVWQTGEIL